MAERKVDKIYKDVAQKIPDVADSKVLPKILSYLLTPEQAKVAAQFPATEEEIATKVGRDLKSVKKDLKYMYELGIGTPAATSKKWNLPRSYGLLVDKVGSHHRKYLPFLGPDYLDLWEEFDEENRIKREKAGELGAAALEHIAGNRILPAYEMVKDLPELQPWESTKGLLQLADKIALVDCTCRLRNRKRTCQEHTTEICFLLNRDADYEVESGGGRYITVDEALQVLNNCEKVGYAHIVMNTRAIVNLLCNCCDDCCVNMRRYKRYGNESGWLHGSRFRPIVNEALCDGCGACATCMFEGIVMKKNAKGQLKAVPNPKTCLGMGNCGVKCPKGAITMECFRPENWIPKGMGTRGVEKRDYPQYAEMV